jgi:hypothetical protein
MGSITALPLARHDPVLVVRAVPFAVLKYQVSNTVFSKPEGLVLNSLASPEGVAIREEAETTGYSFSIIR